jgi:translocation and assembly module TamA
LQGNKRWGWWCCLLCQLLYLRLPAQAADTIAVEVEGAPAWVAANIVARFGELTADEISRPQFPLRARRLVREASQALGFYHATAQLDIDEDSLLVQMEPGPQVVWLPPELAVTGEGSANPRILEVLALHPFQAGVSLNHGVYEAYKNQLLAVVRGQGYPAVEFTTQRLRVDVQANTALPILTLATGKRFTLAALEFIGTRIDDDVLYQLLNLKTGVWYQREMIGQLQRQLMDSGYFQSVDVRPASDEESRKVTLRAYIRDEPGNRYNVGVGVASDSGVYTTLNWNKAIVNDRGHGLRLNTRVSKPVQTVGSRYTIPWSHPRDDYLEWVVGWQGKDYKDTLSYLTTTGVNWRLDKRETKRSVGVNLEYERYEQGSQPRNSTTYILPTVTWTRLKFPTYQDNGYRYGFRLMASSEVLGSDTNFFRGSLNGKYLNRFSEQHSVLIRGEVGRIYASNLEKIPASKRFFAGGQDSVRGFAYESISPRDSNGALTGADKLVTATLQYQWSINRYWALVTFVDAGKAYHNNSEPLRTGVGAGVRWSSPVGAVGIDIGFPVQDDEYGGYQVHFYLGPLI